MKAHIGVDSKQGIVHSVCSTAASVSDVPMLPELLHGGEKKVWGDAGYQGQTEAIHEAAHGAQDMTSRRVKTKTGVDEAEKRRNRTKARARAKVEWLFRILKHVFGFTRVLSRLKEKSRVAVRRLCLGQSLPEPQAARLDESPDEPSWGRSVPAEAAHGFRRENKHQIPQPNSRLHADFAKLRARGPITQR
jgi:IS5 family transposase